MVQNIIAKKILVYIYDDDLHDRFMMLCISTHVQALHISINYEMFTHR
jgi:hypothetical protein